MNYVGNRGVLDLVKKAGSIVGEAIWIVEYLGEDGLWACHGVYYTQDSAYEPKGVDKTMRVRQFVDGGFSRILRKYKSCGQCTRDIIAMHKSEEGGEFCSEQCIEDHDWPENFQTPDEGE